MKNKNQTYLQQTTSWNAELNLLHILLQLSQKIVMNLKICFSLLNTTVYIPLMLKNALSKIPSTIFQYESVHEGKKPFNFTLCVETAITRRQNCMCDTTNISTLIILIFRNK